MINLRLYTYIITDKWRHRVIKVALGEICSWVILYMFWFNLWHIDNLLVFGNVITEGLRVTMN